MNNLCVYCQQFLLHNEKGICGNCKEKLSDRDLDDEYYRQKDIGELFYISIKIDDYFQFNEELPDFDTLLFHKRRVACINECIGHIDYSLFLPRTVQEVNAFREAVKKFYDGELTEKQRDLRINELLKGNYYGKARSAGYEFDAKVTLASLMSSKEKLDWSWWQYMEIVFFGLHKYVNKNQLLGIVEKHFTNEIQCPFDLTGYYK